MPAAGFNLDFNAIAKRILDGVVVAAGVSAVTVLGGFLARNLPGFNPSVVTIGRVVLWCQFAMIAALATLMVVVAPPRTPPAQAESSPEAARATNQFINYWQFVWINLMIFYLVSALQWNSIMENGVTVPPPFSVVLGVLNNVTLIASTSFMLICYFIMTNKSVEQADQLEWSRLKLVVTLVSTAVILISFIKESDLPINDPSLRTMLGDAISMLPNFFCGAVLALFVGRLESRFLGTPRWIVIALFCYALLQIAYVVPDKMHDDQTFKYLTVVALALFLKLLLFLEVNKLIRQGNMANYMFRYRKLLDEKG